MRAYSRAGLLCPVCATPVQRIRVWQQPRSGRIRIFRESGAVRAEYGSLPEAETSVLDYDGLATFAARRLLRTVFDKERADTSDCDGRS